MEKKSYIFSEISFKILNEIAYFDQVWSREIFKEWFNFQYEINEYDEKFLKELIKINEYRMDFYSELQLSLHFISPFLSRVGLNTKYFSSWFETKLQGIINGYKLKGNLDFMLASGKLKPEIPYFFIQEFKKSAPIPKHPRGQLFAQMAVAIENNKINKIRGAYNIGRFWFFVVLEKIGVSKYQYHESKAFDSLDIEHLKQIFIILKSVKHKYCKL
ncbi:MAG: hypothetical protein B6I24_03890 [Bacteroidetes bacterium 4572_128]|nr:MAG: hypothetical protein B6I24_03890 [Bacteroidetes bacterium 4572_128]